MELNLDDINVSSLTKMDLSAMLYDQLGVNKREASELVDAFFGIITDRLVTGEDVKLTDFAVFLVKSKLSRPGRNPKTGATVQIAPRRIVTFQQGPKLKARLNESLINDSPA